MPLADIFLSVLADSKNVFLLSHAAYAAGTSRITCIASEFKLNLIKPCLSFNYTNVALLQALKCVKLYQYFNHTNVA